MPAPALLAVELLHLPDKPAGVGSAVVLIAELDARTDEEWIAADESATDGGDQAVITVPAALLPEIRRLLASHKTA